MLNVNSGLSGNTNLALPGNAWQLILETFNTKLFVIKEVGLNSTSDYCFNLNSKSLIWDIRTIDKNILMISIITINKTKVKGYILLNTAINNNNINDNVIKSYNVKIYNVINNKVLYKSISIIKMFSTKKYFACIALLF